jgi:tetratricopeptide (TPR) repeat protein
MTSSADFAVETESSGDDCFCFWSSAGPATSFATDPEQEERERRLTDGEDWKGLAALRREALADCPCAVCHAALAEALYEAGDYEGALEHLRQADAERPGDILTTELVLECLRALGRAEGDFEWAAAQPRVFRLGLPVLELCVAHLRQRGAWQRVGSLRAELFHDAYLDFTAERLAEALRRDGRLEVVGAGRDVKVRLRGQ